MRGSVTKKRNRWYISFYDGRDAKGKLKRKMLGSWETKKEAEKALRLRIAEIENSFERKAEKSTLETFLRYWLDTYCKPRLAQNTINGYTVNIEKHIIPYIGQITLDHLQPKHIQKLYSLLSEKGLSGTSIRYVHNNLHKALGYAVKTELIGRNPADLVEPPRVNRYEAKTLKPEQVKELLKACIGHEIYIPVILAVTLGLRRGEALGLKWDDVDFDNRVITIQHSASFTKDGIVLSTPKTKNSRRTLLISDEIKKVLEAELSRQQDMRIFKPTYNTLQLVCCRCDGSYISENVLQHNFQDILTEAGLPHIRFHDLRHTNATILLRNAVPAKIVSSMLGHSSIGVTMDIYSHVMTDMQSNAVDVMDNLLKEADTLS